jgi:hypothetical protein
VQTIRAAIEENEAIGKPGAFAKVTAGLVA